MKIDAEVQKSCIKSYFLVFCSTEIQLEIYIYIYESLKWWAIDIAVSVGAHVSKSDARLLSACY